MARTGHRRRDASREGLGLWLGLWVVWGALLAAVGPRAVWAGGDLQVDAWGESDGLPQGTVTSAVRDPDGYLWVGTFAGLFRFSGTRFEEQVAPPEIYAQLARITAMVADPGGKGAWLGVEGGGVWRVAEGRFDTVGQPDELRTATVWDLDWRPGRAAGDEVLVVGSSAGVWQHSTGAGWERLSALPALTVQPVGPETVWVGNHLALWRIAHGVAEPPVLTGSFYGMWADPEGDLWVAEAHGPVLVPQSGSPTVVPGWHDPLPLGVDPVVDREGQVWLGTSEGLARLGPWREAKARILAADPLEAVQVPLDSPPRGLFVDSDGTLWVGTHTSGLRRVTERPFEFLELPEGVRGVSSGPLARGAGRTWLSFDCELLHAHSGAGWVDRVRVDEAPGDPGISRCVHAMAASDDGALYVGYVGHVWRVVDGEWTAVQVGEGGLSPDETPTLLQVDAEQRLWLGTNAGRLFHGVPTTDPPLAPVGLPSTARRVLSLLELDSGDLVVGTDDGAWLRTGGNWQHEGCAGGFACGPVRELVADPSGTVWAATYGGGLGWLADGRAGRVTPAEHGLPDGFLSSVVVGRRGELWLHGNRGLYEVALADLQLSRAGDPGPLLSHRVDVGEANGWARPSSALDADGTLWLVTVDGLVRYSLETRRETFEPSRVHLTSMRVGAVSVELGDHDVVLDAELGRTVELAFSTPVLRPDQVARYAYRLVPDDSGPDGEAFSAPTGRASVVFAGLEPGGYTFDVRSVGAGGAVGPTTSLRFEVTRAWHEHPALPLLLTVVVVGGIAVLAMARLRAAEARTRALTRTLEEQQAVEDRLERQRRFYRQVFDTAGISLLLFDAAGQCLEVNREACNLFGVDRTALLAWTPAHLGLESGRTVGTAGRCRRPDGTTFAARVVSASFVSDEQRYFLVSVADLSGLLARRARAEHARLQWLVQHRESALVRFVRTRTADASVSPGAGGIAPPTDGAPALEALWAEAGDADATVDVDAACRALERELGPVLPTEVELGVTLRAGGRAAMARVDFEFVLTQILVDLLTEAAGSPTLQLSTRLEAGEVVVSVTVVGGDRADAGGGLSGLPPSVVPAAGRAAARERITAVGGIWTESQPAFGGTTVTLTLPGAIDAPADGDGDRLHLATPLPGGRQAHVCVVDDNAHVLRALQVPLELAGYRVTAFDDPQQALEWCLAAAVPPDLLVTDVVMPGLTGRQLADAFNRAHPELPVLFVSGYTDDVVLRRGVDGSIENLLVKPFVRHDLLARVDRLLAPLRET